MVKVWLLIALGLFLFFLIVFISIKTFIVDYKDLKEKEKGNFILNAFFVCLDIIASWGEIFYLILFFGVISLVSGLVLLR